jgi:hypothetical protein
VGGTRLYEDSGTRIPVVCGRTWAESVMFDGSDGAADWSGLRLGLDDAREAGADKPDAVEGPDVDKEFAGVVQHWRAVRQGESMRSW